MSVVENLKVKYLKEYRSMVAMEQGIVEASKQMKKRVLHKVISITGLWRNEIENVIM